MGKLDTHTFDSLTGLRFVLAIWIAVFHLGHMYDPTGYGSWAIMEAGVARVDVFFVLSGFVLTHVYFAREGARFNFGSFMLARFARLYPLHLLALSMLLALVVGAHLIGRPEAAAEYTGTGLLANVFLLQAWGVPGAGIWNFPAWTISAEFFGYLLFPLFLWVAGSLRSRPLVFLFGAVGGVLALDAAFRVWLGRPLTQSTMDLGALRGAAVMLVGVAARMALDAWSIGPKTGAALAIVGALAAGLAAMFHTSTAFVALGGAMLVMGLAARDAAGAMSPLDGKVMTMLGRWSYGIFILHVPVFVTVSQAADVLNVPFEINLPTVAVMTALLIVISGLAHNLVEEPARRGIRGERPKKARWTAPKGRSFGDTMRVP